MTIEFRLWDKAKQKISMNLDYRIKQNRVYP